MGSAAPNAHQKFSAEATKSAAEPATFLRNEPKLVLQIIPIREQS
jgi:hypothetical protein